MSTNKTVILLLLLAGALPLAGGEKITVKGSDTMVILGQRWAERYMAAHPQIRIQVTGGGSGTGISALINGTTDICNSSRPMKEAERARLREKYGSRGVEIKCALDGLAVYVHAGNPVRDLSLRQLRDIFTGSTTNWKALGGPDRRIILYSRENNSGTYVYFKDEVLGGADFAPHAQHMPGTAAVVHAVARDPWGIGYGGAAYGKGIREMSIRREPGSPAFPPAQEHIRSGAYPISRFLYLYTLRRPAGALRQYVDWILGDEGQAIVSSVGYFPIR
ncbi:MAG: phosphate ABC transporter substrate-binding protein [Bacteroidota bacterium]